MPDGSRVRGFSRRSVAWCPEVITIWWNLQQATVFVNRAHDFSQGAKELRSRLCQKVRAIPAGSARREGVRMSEGKQQTSSLQAAAAVVGTSFAAASASTSQTETPAAGGEPEKRKRGRPRKPKPRAEQVSGSRCEKVHAHSPPLGGMHCICAALHACVYVRQCVCMYVCVCGSILCVCVCLYWSVNASACTCVCVCGASICWNDMRRRSGLDCLLCLC